MAEIVITEAERRFMALCQARLRRSRKRLEKLAAGVPADLTDRSIVRHMAALLVTCQRIEDRALANVQKGQAT